MYQSIFFDRKTSTINLWDDKNGHVAFKYHPYAFRKKKGGKYKSIYGDELEKTDKFHRDDQNLFEADVPVETRVLVDAYSESDDVSTGHRVSILDIEVDSVNGYPDVKKPKRTTFFQFTRLFYDSKKKLFPIA